MGRHRSAQSYGHSIKQVGGVSFMLRWMVDFYYAGSRQRFPRQFQRLTDEAGARRFCKRWNVLVKD